MDEIEELQQPLEPSESSKCKRRAGRLGGLSRSEAKRMAVKSNLAKARLSRWPGREAAAVAAANQALSKVNGGMANLHDNADIALDRTLEMIAREEGVLTNGSIQEALHPRANSRDGSLRPPGEEEGSG